VAVQAYTNLERHSLQVERVVEGFCAEGPPFLCKCEREVIGKVESRVVSKWTRTTMTRIATALLTALAVGNQQLAQQLIITQLMICSNSGPHEFIELLMFISEVQYYI
jgi:hypothetical protein